MSREGRRTMEKVLENTVRDSRRAADCLHNVHSSFPFANLIRSQYAGNSPNDNCSLCLTRPAHT